MKSLTFFNNKGGVGKTTSLCNIAAYLALERHNKVLLIDADPQCNASIYMLGEENLFEHYESGCPTITSVVRPLQAGEGYLTNESEILTHSDNFGVDLIVGDTAFSMSEDFLSQDWVDAIHGESRGLKTTLIFSHLLASFADRYDFILFDIGPSLGAINRDVLISSDYFIIPMSSDIFSLKALANIGDSLTKWKNELRRGLSENKEKDPQHFAYQTAIDSIDNPKLLGYLCQQYLTRSKDGVARPVQAYDNIINEIPRRMGENLAGFIPESISRNLDLGFIPNFNSLIPMSQLAHKPVFTLTQENGIIGAHYKKVNEYKALMGTICSHILSNIDAL